MRLSDLQDKDIISIIDGKMIGKIIDAEIDNEGKIKTLIIQKTKFFNISSGNIFELKWNQIKTIGSDVILIDI